MGDVDPDALGAVQTTILGDDAHVWRASLEQPGAVIAQFHRLLAADEIARAARFRFDRDRNRYIVGRGLLRTLLGSYLRCPPDMLRFEYGAFEKPRLAGEGPQFNLSHSGSLALLAFTNDVEIGVDVELSTVDFARERIAERFFSTAEVAVLRSLPEPLQPYAFLTCWTRKEAFIKARGDGLSLPLDSFDVSLAPDEPAALLRTAWSAAEPTEWFLQDLSDSTRCYVAAIAIRNEVRRIISRDVAGGFAVLPTTQGGVT
jgi:4'-phosphopantetheinyl transferase